jgi:hypothetical protein
LNEAHPDGFAVNTLEDFTGHESPGFSDENVCDPITCHIKACGKAA